MSDPKNSTPPSMTCPDCGARNEVGATTCHECNHPLQLPGEPMSHVAVPAGAPGAHDPHSGHEPRGKGGGEPGAPAVRRPRRPERPERAPATVATLGYRPARASGQGGVPSWIWMALGLAAIGIVLFSAIQIANAPKPVPIPNASPEQQAAGDSLRNLLRSDSTLFAPNVALGNVYYDTGNFGDAIRFYERALRKQPGSHSVQVDLAVSYYNVGNTPVAIGILEEVVSHEPTHAIATFNLGVVYQAAGRMPEARTMFERAKTLHGPPQMNAVIDQLLARMEAGEGETKAASGSGGGLPPGHPPIDGMGAPPSSGTPSASQLNNPPVPPPASDKP